MKKIILSAALLASGLAFAQKGTVLVAGNIGYSDVDNSFEEEKSFYFNPKVGYQFSDNWTAGIEGSFGKEEISDDLSSEEITTTKFGPFVRYAVPFSDTFAAYADLGAGYQKQSYDDIDADGFYAGLTPALFINFKNSFGLNVSIGGINYSKLSGDLSDAKSLSFDFGKNFGLGISKNF